MGHPRYFSLHSRPRSAFTLIELLVVIAIIAILAVVVVLVLNPAELLKQARDANRLSDLSTLNSALNLYSTDQSQSQSFSLGNASSVYVSLPDTSPTCSNLNLPSLPAGYTYHCSSSSISRNTDGTGWIPVDLQNVSAGSPLGSLPIDPINQSSTGLYYTYSTDGTRFQIVTALPESTKQKTALDQTPLIAGYPGVMAQGSSLTVSPIYSLSSLVGWWPLNEGSGTIAYDRSGNGNNGTWQGTSSYGAGKVGNYAAFFGGSENVNIGTPSSINMSGQPFTLSVWFNPAAGNNDNAVAGSSACGNYDFSFAINNYTQLQASYNNFGVNAYYSTTFSPGVWYMITEVVDGSYLRLYLNGIQVATAASSLYAFTQEHLNFGVVDCQNYANGFINDARLYNRALSSAEILALYNAEK